jgi:histidinol dehydrogenase
MTPLSHPERSEGSAAPSHPERSEGSAAPSHPERSEGSAAQRVTLRYTGSLDSLSDDERRTLIARATAVNDEVSAATARIIAKVRSHGDRALFALATSLDGVELESLEVPRAALERALDDTEPPLRRAMERAAANIASVHRAFLPIGVETQPEPGILVGRRPDPLKRVGVYAPGGRAAYPSSVLMGAVPARVAGVREVILASPPQSNGRPADSVLAAAQLAGVDRVFAIGGAGAVAAMAIGTESVPRVERIVGPGNAYVAAAKSQLSGEVGIDCTAGPSELLIIADESASADRIALEMIAQAEHDPMACVLLLALHDGLASDVEAALRRLVATTPRWEIVARALGAQGGVLRAGSLEQALAFSNAFAPEHLLLMLRDVDVAQRCVCTAGTLFLGDTSVALGDYLTGANHVLPTGGTARWSSGLSPLDFVRWTTYQRVDTAAARALASDVALLAQCEGLPGHAAAALSGGGVA